MPEIIRHDIVIVGGGAAGLRAAIAAVESTPAASVAMVSKVYPMRSHTVSAEGGAAAVAREDDSFVFNTELVAALELGNMLDVAEALAVSAAHRKESRGAHTRRDFAARDDQNFLCHTLCSFDPAGPRLGRKAVTLGVWQPEERKY